VNKSGIVVHGTVYMDNSEPLHNIPSYVINHGILNGEDLHTLLRRSKVRKILRSLYKKKDPKKTTTSSNVIVFLAICNISSIALFN